MCCGLYILYNPIKVYNETMSAINTPTYMRLREQLRKDIIAGIWPLGSHVTLAQLSAHYQVSANPVREALLQLQGEGVVAMRMNRGAVIPTVDAQYIGNIYKVRGAIQMMLVRDAAQKATPADVELLRLHAAAYSTASQSGDAAACVEANRVLHHSIDQLSGNSLACEMLESRSSLVDAYRRSIGYGRGRTEAANTQHLALIEAIAAGDPDKAAALSFQHTEAARLDLLATLPA